MEDVPENQHEVISVFAGFTGTWMLAFSDTFWRIATEVEVYSLSIALFMAVILLAWMGREQNNLRYFLLAALLTGLGICVHLTNFLVFPILLTLFILKNKKSTSLESGKAVFHSLWISAVLGVWWSMLLPEISVFWDIHLAGSHRLFFLPPGIGILFTYLMTLLVLLLILYFTRYKVIVFALGLFHLGLSPYALIPIRASANLPVNLGVAPDAVSFKMYLDRDEFGKAPLLWGSYYTHKKQSTQPQKYAWDSDLRKYIHNPDSHRKDHEIKPENVHFFPRMHNPEYSHDYRNWVMETGLRSDPRTDFPDLWDNLHFFFDYQIGHEFLRYIGWNLCGRKYDTPDSPAIIGLGKRLDHPAVRFPPGRTPYLMLPLIACVLGVLAFILYQPSVFRFWLLWFILTGPLLVFLVNMTPGQVRERDYIYLFTLISVFFVAGFAVPFVTSLFYQIFSGLKYPLGLLLILLPLFMFFTGFHAHDKSKDTIAWHFAKHTLDVCPSNSVLFTGGDNDAFPIWCLQQVYRVRKDVKVFNINLLQREWYIKQQKSDPVYNALLPDLVFPDSMFMFGRNEYMSAATTWNGRSVTNIIPWDKEFSIPWKRNKWVMMNILLATLESPNPSAFCYSSLVEPDYLSVINHHMQNLGMIYQYQKDSFYTHRQVIDKLLNTSKLNSPIQGDYLHHTGRSFQRKLKSIFLSIAENPKASPTDILMLMERMEKNWPSDLILDPTPILARTGALFHKAGNKQKAFQYWAKAAYRSHGLQCWYQYKGWEELKAGECEHSQILERTVRSFYSGFSFKNQWFTPHCLQPCQQRGSLIY